MRIEGKIIDIENREIFSGSVDIEAGKIVSINHHDTTVADYIMLGFIDAHLHIESSLLTPAHFGELVVGKGTVAVVTDPHEIANVLGSKGVDYMIESSANSPINMYFTIPSCVPATPFDVAGAVVTAQDVEDMASSGRFVALSEVMNVPGVLMGDEELARKLKSARDYGLVIDGHAPMLTGDDLQKYISRGITTDHECFTLEEAQEKISKGMKILIREGSAAKNYEQLKPLIKSHPHSVMFCTDDSHPDDIISDGHIDKIVRRAIADGYDLFDVLRIASLNSIKHYGLDQGALKVGDKADFIVVEDLKDFRVKQQYAEGRVIYDVSDKNICMPKFNIPIVNNFNHDLIACDDLCYAVSDTIPVIGLIKNELVTRAESYTPKSYVNNLESNLEQDVLKIVYINRYQNSVPQVAFIRGFGLQRGAIASTVSHDSHNIIAVGSSDREIVKAVNSIISSKGGLVVASGDDVFSLELPMAGIMSEKRAKEVADIYGDLQNKIYEMGCLLESPFMTLSFMSLVVIPELKIGEQGLFSYSKFNWVG
ncbi:MAG: adenine deaminase [Rikenellaceae bacterium]